MFARAIYIFLALVAVLLFAYSHFYEAEEFAIYSVAPFILAAIVFILAPQINWWYYEKNPPKTDEDLRKILGARCEFYRNLSEENKAEFERRTTMFMMAKQFTPKVHDEVPEDMKAIIAASAVQLTFHQKEDWLFDEYETFIIYPHPFPTPQHEAWHVSETYAEDGVMLFSAEHLLHGFFEPLRYYQIALHEFAGVFIDKNPEILQTDFGENPWQSFQRISNFSEEKIKAYIGLENVSPEAVGVTLFFTHRTYFAQHLPGAFKTLQGVFG